MQLRDCAGGVVFCGDRVFIMKNEKGEWVLPKGMIRDGLGAESIALKRIHEECGIEATIIDSAGRTYYEFYSITRQHPVCNRIAWYVMMAPDESCTIGEPDKIREVGYFPISTALDMITYSQDKTLVRQSWKKYCDKTDRDSRI